jgi:hypothetical protein
VVVIALPRDSIKHLVYPRASRIHHKLGADMPGFTSPAILKFNPEAAIPP